jgi:hypothetical protein
MLARVRRHLTYANVASSLALFLALGGGVAFAVTRLDPNSVKSKHIVNGQVKARDITSSAFHSAGLPSHPAETCVGIGDQWVSASVTRPVGYYRDPLGEVHLTGVIFHCGNPTNQFFTLPRGFRPAAAERASARGGAPTALLLPMLRTSGALGEMTTLSVFQNGEVSVAGSDPGDEFSLNGISFRCGPSGENGCR